MVANTPLTTATVVRQFPRGAARAHAARLVNGLDAFASNGRQPADEVCGYTSEALQFLDSLDQRSRPFNLAIGMGLTGLVGVVDYLSGYELAFSLFYLIPISFVTWVLGQPFGVGTAVAGAVLWLSADLGAGHPYTHPLIPVWNTLIRLNVFLIISFLLSGLKRSMEHEREMARVDGLTGAVNSRHFFELARMETERTRRNGRPFTLVYVDLDNFKAVNDRLGHGTGDDLLCAVVSVARNCLRKIDVVARLGGDEFALLLPETGEEAARATLTKLQSHLLGAMRGHEWPVTFSMGALTCNATTAPMDELVKIADGLMYAVKRDGKNSFRQASFNG